MWVAPRCVGDGLHQFDPGCRDDDDVVAVDLVVGDEVGGLGEDQWIDDVVQRLGHDRTHLVDVPPGAHSRQVCPHAGHLIGIGTGEQEKELGVATLQHGTPIQQALVEERLAERERARLREHRLVEVEERGDPSLTGVGLAV